MCERGHTKYIIKARAEVDQSHAAIKKAHMVSVRSGKQGWLVGMLAVGGDGGHGLGYAMGWDGNGMVVLI